MEGEVYEGNSFSFALGYHISPRCRADIGFTEYKGTSEAHGIVAGGNGQVTHPEVYVADIPLRVYYDLRKPGSGKRWNFHVLGLLAYTHIRETKEVEVFSGGVRSIRREKAHYNTVVAGAGAGIRYRLVPQIEPFFDVNMGTGITKGVFKGGGIMGVKINFI